jgi:hypothetical protein
MRTTKEGCRHVTVFHTPVYTFTSYQEPRPGEGATPPGVKSVLGITNVPVDPIPAAEFDRLYQGAHDLDPDLMDTWMQGEPDEGA